MYYIPQFSHMQEASSVYHIKMGGWGRKMFKFDKGRGFPFQVGVILGLGFAVCWLGDMYMMWRLITGCSYVMLVVTALQCNQHCEKISGSQCKTLIKIAVIIVRLQLWFSGFPNICPQEEGPHMNENRQYRCVSTLADALLECTHVHDPTSFCTRVHIIHKKTNHEVYKYWLCFVFFVYFV